MKQLNPHEIKLNMKKNENLDKIKKMTVDSCAKLGGFAQIDENYGVFDNRKYRLVKL